MKDAIINARIESKLKLDVEAILKQLGITATQVDIKIPNKETQKVIEEVKKGINVDDFSFDELKQK